MGDHATSQVDYTTTEGDFIVSVLNPYSVAAVSHQGNSVFLYSDWRTWKQLGSYSLPPLHS